MIHFSCDNETLTEAYKIALADVAYNIKTYKGGILQRAENCILAGANYDRPWTRDASINVWNAIAFLSPEVAKNTLLSVTGKNNNGYYIAGQYWDAIIWTIGAYHYINVTGDTEFLKIAQESISNSLASYEKNEFDAQDGLFRGPAVYGDGIAAYPDKYANSTDSGILSWINNPVNLPLKATSGYGIPMKALSTNCVYYQAYVLLAEMNKMMGLDPEEPLSKAAALKDAINKIFWNEEKGSYDYLAYECDYQEALGIAFALLFGIADDRQATLVLENAKITENGIACVYPSFDRYLKKGGYGRHAGTVWPHAQSFWARACGKYGYTRGYENELFLMAEKAVRDNQFWEIYHPDTGEVYGGLQGFGKQDISVWGSVPHQVWSATGYLAIIYDQIFGIEVGDKTVTFAPSLPTGVKEATLSGMKIGSTTFDVVITTGTDHPSSASFDTTVQGSVRVYLSVD